MKPKGKNQNFFRRHRVPKYRSILTKSIRSSHKHIIYLVYLRLLNSNEKVSLQDFLEYKQLHFPGARLMEMKLFPSMSVHVIAYKNAVPEKFFQKDNRWKSMYDLLKYLKGNFPKVSLDRVLLSHSFMICVPRLKE